MKNDNAGKQIRSLDRYLTRWGFSPKKTVKRDYEKSSMPVQAWLQSQYPGLEQRTKAKGAEFLHDTLCRMRLKFLSFKVHFATTEHTRHLIQMR